MKIISRANRKKPITVSRKAAKNAKKIFA